VDREKARFSAWYELFPRSCATVPEQHGTFKDCEALLPYVAAMGFDVLYLPPIHPIGQTHRKGKNNTPVAAPDDPGSPWAIGSEAGGHKAIHPQLGTLEDFRRLIARAGQYGVEIAIDLALQCSPDHPYVHEHPEWFRWRPDGTVQYAENPPKKYEDIYPFAFETTHWPQLWKELKSVVLFWIEQGVGIFRVDNPHTKPFRFWEWLIGEVKAAHPEVIFLAEAFTRPKIMYHLAKLGFTQSYTYFAWRHTQAELTQYFTELTQTPVREYLRPNLWPNTPDILTEYLQFGGRPAFMLRLVLAATLGASYGIYGPAFELCEHLPREAGSEEYLDSEKYALRHWNYEREDSLKDLMARVNRIRRENPALQSDWSLRLHPTDNTQLLCYSKQSDDGANVIIVVVNLDPYHTQAGWVELPLSTLGLEPHQPYQVHDLLGEARYLWHGPRNYVELNPQGVPAAILRVRRRVRTEREFEYYL
jgi:starch synthase (maltosyl-transferring)